MKNSWIKVYLIFQTSTIQYTCWNLVFDQNALTLMHWSCTGHDSIMQTQDEGSFVLYWKAFNTVDHKILLCKLEYYGIQCKCNDWFKSYLSDRKQCVSINGYKYSINANWLGCTTRFCPRTTSFFKFILIIFIRQFNTAKRIPLMMMQIFFIQVSL